MINQSRRARRMERNHKMHKRAALNLVSLMDIFTILVFFLLVSSSNAPQLPSSKDIHLPTSVAKKVPEETLVIAVTDKDILVQGRSVASVADVMRSEETVIEGLKDELLFQAKNATRLRSGAPVAKQGRTATVMGDENMPYELLRKILTSCRHANYTHIAFAAMQKPKASG